MKERYIIISNVSSSLASDLPATAIKVNEIIAPTIQKAALSGSDLLDPSKINPAFFRKSSLIPPLFAATAKSVQ